MTIKEAIAKMTKVTISDMADLVYTTVCDLSICQKVTPPVVSAGRDRIYVGDRHIMLCDIMAHRNSAAGFIQLVRSVL